ncbi:MAG: phosphodiesterase [Lachnospiraceae bacterium]|nr:phosphodiesterase [Lachnospiraceae bacterium]
MKWLIASDIHGSEYYCKEVLKAFDNEQADRLLLLGDILYHGPRNDLPKDYAPKKVTALLNERKDSILCVRGNCDADVDQFVLEFPILAEYAVIDLENRLLYANHGHVYGELNPPPLKKGDILLCGHTHVPKCVEYETFVYMNPGSASLPKEYSHHGYMTLENGVFRWKDFDGTEFMRYIN